MGLPSVTLYSRPGCHLCDDAREVILEVGSRVVFELHEVDIESSEDLIREYGVRIPVVAVDGREMWDYRVDEAEFEEAVRSAGGTQRSV